MIEEDEDLVKLTDNKNKNNNSKKNNKQINKETQNAFVQVNFLNEIIENERKNILLKYKEKENEMKLKIKNLIQNMKLVKFESKKEILELKTKINEKKEEIIDLRNIITNLKKQIESLNDKIGNLNNKILELKKKDILYSIRRNYGDSNELNKNNDDEKQNNRYADINEIDSLPTMKKRQNEKNQIQDELEKIKEFKKIIPTRSKLNRSTNDFQNKIKFNSLLINLDKTSKNLFNRNGLKNLNKIEPNLSISYLNNKLSNNRKKENLEKMRKEYSVRINNNIFEELNNGLSKRSNSAGIKNLKKSPFLNDKINKNLFNSTDRRALSTLIYSHSQEELIGVDKKMNLRDNQSGDFLKKLLLKKNVNKKEEISFHRRNRNNENLK